MGTPEKLLALWCCPKLHLSALCMISVWLVPVDTGDTHCLQSQLPHMCPDTPNAYGKL